MVEEALFFIQEQYVTVSIHAIKETHIPFVGSITNNAVSLPNGKFLIQSQHEFYLFDGQTKSWGNVSVECTEDQFQFFGVDMKFGMVSNNNSTVSTAFMNSSNNNKNINHTIYALSNVLMEFGIFELNCDELKMVFKYKYNLPIMTQSSSSNTTALTNPNYFISPYACQYIYNVHQINNKFYFLTKNQQIVFENDQQIMEDETSTFLRYSYDSCYSPLTKCMYILGGTEHGRPVNTIYEGNGKNWKKLESCALPLRIKKPIVHCTLNGEYVIVLGGTDGYSLYRAAHKNTSINKRIFIFDVKQKKCYESIICLPYFSICHTHTVLVNNKYEDELSVFGFIRSEFKRKEYDNVPSFPDYLIHFMTKWICNEYLHVMDYCTFGGYSDLSLHQKINIDHILEPIISSNNDNQTMSHLRPAPIQFESNSVSSMTSIISNDSGEPPRKRRKLNNSCSNDTQYN